MNRTLKFPPLYKLRAANGDGDRLELSSLYDRHPYIPALDGPALRRCPNCNAWTQANPCHNCGKPIPPLVAGGQGRADYDPAPRPPITLGEFAREWGLLVACGAPLVFGGLWLVWMLAAALAEGMKR